MKKRKTRISIGLLFFVGMLIMGWLDNGIDKARLIAERDAPVICPKCKVGHMIPWVDDDEETPKLYLRCNVCGYIMDVPHN